MKRITIIFDEDYTSKINRQTLSVDADHVIPFHVGYLSEIIPQKNIKGSKYEEILSSAFNRVGLLKQTINVGYGGHYYFEVRPKYYLSNIIVEPEDVELNLLVNKTSFLYQLINHSDTRKSISITGQLKKDEGDMYSRVCENLKDLGWRKYYLEKMLIENRHLPEYDQYPQYMTAKQVASYLQVVEKTVYNWTSAGTIPSSKVNGIVRYDKAKIEKWLK